ncbi:hypothetical protein TVAG_077010 [Trichomonas vaginalis G3]|uniref:Peptidase M16C associated domain-containing protein n=1 Tax=Trichomonas vaginalis (strain ATCC PRA-98 / G3) TaxID=412133 RepID=A2D9U8_TRIV3|nr:metallopeptidase protein [Trichomonas vaginalis G3]EAY22954.1 hypothetical protein TVAG_077010 [Trichomonas vaginalis G3]KAI5527294.1 metallopeptidase protein [Trichomonas vaginalis G3]|eukprot:XP_001583940.1 hypothetical protein [Trichomonas vaginalis G3]
MTWEVERIKKLLAVQPKYFELVMRRRLFENQNRIDIDFVNDNNFESEFNSNLSQIISKYSKTERFIQNTENEENEKNNFSNFSFSEILDSFYKPGNVLGNGFVYSYEEPTNDVVYIRIKNSINLDEELLEDFPIFLTIFGKTGVDGMSQKEFDNLIEKFTGGISIKYLVSASYDSEDTANLTIIIEGKSLSKNANNLIEYMTSLISKPNLIDPILMMDILQETYDLYTKHLMINATLFSQMFSAAALSRGAALQEMLFGVTFYKRLGKYLNNDKRENILDLISRLYDKKFINGDFSASLHCNCESRQRIEKRLLSLMEKLNSHQPIEKGIDTIRLFISEMSIYQKSAFKSDHSLSSVTFSIPVPPIGKKIAAAYYVTAKMICKGYLNEIVDSSYGERVDENTSDPLISVIYFTIENVKNVTEMSDKMMSKLKSINERTFTEEDMRKCIYAILKRINAPRDPSTRNIDTFLSGFSIENKTTFFRDLFYLNLSDIYTAIRSFMSSKIHIAVVAKSSEIKQIENFSVIQYTSD